MKRVFSTLLFFLVLVPAKGAVETHSISRQPDFFIVDSWISGMLYGFFSADSCKLKQGWKRANRTAANDVKIWGGLFVSDPNRKFAGRALEHASRITYELPQTATGFLYAHFENTIGGNVDTVRYKYGSVVLTGRHGLFFNNGGPAVTMGNYIIGYENLHANMNNPIFQHEYGHYLQSRGMGLAYFGRIAIPSIRSEHGNYRKNYSCHDFHPAELDANRRGFLYFNRYFPDFRDDKSMTGRVSTNKGWDFDRNPLTPVGEALVLRKDTVYYVDYQNKAHVSDLQRLRVQAKWYDYMFLIVSGFYNSYQYNH